MMRLVSKFQLFTANAGNLTFASNDDVHSLQRF